MTSCRPDENGASNQKKPLTNDALNEHGHSAHINIAALACGSGAKETSLAQRREGADLRNAEAKHRGTQLRGHLTCANKRAQADAQKLARNEGFLALPTMHLLCMCSMLVPSEFSHLRRRSAHNVHFCTFPGICCITESVKKLLKLFGSALSHLKSCLFGILARVIAQEAPKTLKWPSGCARLLVCIRSRPTNARAVILVKWTADMTNDVKQAHSTSWKLQKTSACEPIIDWKCSKYLQPELRGWLATGWGHLHAFLILAGSMNPSRVHMAASDMLQCRHTASAAQADGKKREKDHPIVCQGGGPLGSVVSGLKWDVSPETRHKLKHTHNAQSDSLQSLPTLSCSLFTTCNSLLHCLPQSALQKKVWRNWTQIEQNRAETWLLKD